MRKGFVLPILIFVILSITIGISVWAYRNYSQINKKSQTRSTNLSVGTSENKQATVAALQKNEWSIYKNDTFGYQINYPSDWIVTPLGQDDRDKNQAIVISRSAINKSLFDSDKFDSGVYVESIPVSIDYTFEQWWKDHEENINYGFADGKADFSQIKFPRDKIYLDATDNTTGKLVWETIIYWKDNFVYIISSKNLKGIWNDKPYGDIVSSFTLNPNRNTLGWHLYTSPLGFSMNIPNVTNVSTESNSDIRISSTIMGYLFRAIGFGISLKIHTYPNPQHLSVPEWYKQSLINQTIGIGSDIQLTQDEATKLAAGQAPSFGGQFGILKPTVLGSFNGYSTLVFGGDQSGRNYYVSNGNNILLLSYAEDEVNPCKKICKTNLFAGRWS